MADPEKMPQYTVAVWQADGMLPIPLAVTSITKEIEGTLVKQRRPYQDGAKLDDMGRDVVVWSIAVDFFNGCTEPGIPSANYFPDYASAMEKTTEVQKTGTLTIGRDGPVRGRIKHLRTVESAEARDMAAMAITFWQDREDGTTAANFAPSAASALPVLGAQLGQMALDAGLWSEGMPELLTKVDELANLLGSADNLLADALAVAGAVLALAALIEDALSVYYDESAPGGATLALQPEAADFVMTLRRIRNHAAQAQATLKARSPRIRHVTFKRVVSIFDVAAEYAQDMDALVALNTGKLDPEAFYAIPVGTPVLIEAA